MHCKAAYCWRRLALQIIHTKAFPQHICWKWGHPNFYHSRTTANVCGLANAYWFHLTGGVMLQICTLWGADTPPAPFVPAPLPHGRWFKPLTKLTPLPPSPINLIRTTDWASWYLFTVKNCAKIHAHTHIRKETAQHERGVWSYRRAFSLGKNIRWKLAHCKGPTNIPSALSRTVAVMRMRNSERRSFKATKRMPLHAFLSLPPCLPLSFCVCVHVRVCVCTCIA